MGANSKIEWCDHTFNIWWGCTRVGGSPACEECYAEDWAAACGYGEHPKSADKFPIWGDNAQRRYFGDKHWNEPLKWDRAAAKSGAMANVFCESMGDWAEGRSEQLPHLERFWSVVRETPHLRYLMLTKRPQLISKLCPIKNDPRVWQGTTAESQKWLDLRWEHLKRVEASVYFLSMEPLVEPVILPDDFLALGKRAWCIVGGQSGARAKPMHPDWVRSLRDQCVAAGVPFHFKQWGEWTSENTDAPIKIRLTGEGRNGSDLANAGDAGNEVWMSRVGKKAAGRLLGGRTWDESPANGPPCEETLGRPARHARIKAAQ